MFARLQRVAFLVLPLAFGAPPGAWGQSGDEPRQTPTPVQDDNPFGSGDEQPARRPLPRFPYKESERKLLVELAKLRNDPPTDEEAKHWEADDAEGRCRMVVIGGEGSGQVTSRHLRLAAKFERLERLWISGPLEGPNYLEPADFKDLRPASRLKELRLDRFDNLDAHCKYLADFEGLLSIHIYLGSGLTVKGVRALTAIEGLEGLFLEAEHIDYRMLREITKKFRKLRFLYVASRSWSREDDQGYDDERVYQTLKPLRDLEFLQIDEGDIVSRPTPYIAAMRDRLFPKAVFEVEYEPRHPILGEMYRKWLREHDIFDFE